MDAISATWTWLGRSMSVILLPVSTAVLLYHLTALDPMVRTEEHSNSSTRLSSLLVQMDVIGLLNLLGPEDLVYDPRSNVIYTGCSNGEIRLFTVSDIPSKTTYRTIAYTGGRPLGVTLSNQGHLLVADADKGLLDVSLDGKIKVLSTGAGGIPFKLVDGVTQANDGMIYFTDASCKYALHEYLLDILERKPYGRLMSYNPKTNVTKVLLDELYFANGVTMMPNQKTLIFCETSMARCRKYYIRGEKRGKVEKFIEDLPGLPDSIHYDKDEGLYWIALSMDVLGSRSPDITQKNSNTTGYRCGEEIVPNGKRRGGILVVDSTGDTKTFYYDPELALITTVIRVKNYAYIGSATYPYILRINLAKYNTSN